MYRDILRYNARICTGLGAWIIVVPVAATMLVLFALMAMTSLIRESTPVLILELLGSLLMAFVGVNLLRPEYQYDTLETVLTRTLSFRVILTVRVFFAGLAVLALEALLCLYMRTVMDKEISTGLALLSAAASMAFLTALAIAVAAAWRSPTLGFIAAAVYWALDVVAGPQLNPLLTLHGYAEHIHSPDDVLGVWWPGKVALAVLALILGIAGARAGTRPAVQRNARLWARTVVGLLLLAVTYVASGAAYKVEWGRRHEEMLMNRSRLWYQQAFSIYRPLPVAYVLGAAFPRFIGYRAPWTPLPSDSTENVSQGRRYQLEQLKIAAFGHPDSRWADNALYELGRMTVSNADDSPEGEDTRLGVQCLEILVSEHPSSPFAPLALAKLAAVYDRAGRATDAEKAADRLLSLYPRSSSAQDVGQALLARLTDPGAPGGPRLQDALEIAEKLVQNADEHQRPAALEQLARILAHPQLGRYDEAAAKLDEARGLAQDLALEIIAMDDPSAEDINQMRELGALRQRVAGELDELRATGRIQP